MPKTERFVKRLPRLLAAVGLFLALVGTLEILLGFLPLDRYDGRFSPRSSFPLFVPGEGENAVSYVTNPHFRKALNFQKFGPRKGEGVFRIFVLGGSAAFGWPGKESDSFTGYLRRALDQAAQGRFEIVNAAGMSYGSHRVLDLLKDVVRFEPDLVVIYSGNNEYVERNLLPPGERRGGLLYSVRDQLSRSNVYRALRLAVWKAPGLGKILDRSGADITDLRASPAVARAVVYRSPEIDELVLRNYRQNLSEMVRILEGRSIPSVFCSIPVNLDSWQPSEPPLRHGNQDELLRWVAKVREGKESLAGNPARASDIFGELLRMKSDWAPGAYYRGKALQALGNHAGALEMFAAARDRDARPLRAPGSFNEAIRASALAGRKTRFLDLEAIFRAKSPHGITGETLVRDYCHPTEAGHKLIAASLVPVVLPARGAEEILRLAEDSIARDAHVRAKTPMARASELYATGMTYFYNGRPREAEKAFLEVLKLNSTHLAAMNNLGHIYIDRKRFAEARELFRRALAIDPGYIKANYSLGLLRLEEGDLAGAEECMRVVLSLNPQFPTAWVLLGDIAERKATPGDALKFYGEALSMGFEDSHLHLMMGKAYMALGDKPSALRELGKALEFDPANEEAARLLETST